MTADEGERDLVTEVFERMRHAAKDSGRRVPSLQRPPRRKAGWQGFDSASVARIDEEAAGSGVNVSGSHSAGDGGEQGANSGASQNSAGLVQRAEKKVRDRAGTIVPEHLLHDRGIRINRRYDRRPKTLGSVLSNQIVERGWQIHIAHGVIMTEWDSLVGETVSEHTRVREFNEGTLIVDCESTAWATQLRYLQSMILKAIANRVGDGVVTELKIYGPKPPKMYKGRLRVKGRGPRDTYG